MYKICNIPDEMECLDSRCFLIVGCKYLDRCMNQLVEDVYRGASCICNYMEDGVQVYKIPDCIIFTDSPTARPTMSSSINSSVVGHTIKENVEDNVDENLVYYILGPVLFVLFVLLVCFRRRVMDCFNCNRVSDDVETTE